MGKHQDTNLLSKDVIQGIKHFCFNNLSEFYARYRDRLSMSRATFFRIIRGDYTSDMYLCEIDRLCFDLGIADEKGGSSLVVRSWACRELLSLIRSFYKDFSLETLEKIKKFADEYEGILLS